MGKQLLCYMVIMTTLIRMPLACGVYNEVEAAVVETEIAEEPLVVEETVVEPVVEYIVEEPATVEVIEEPVEVLSEIPEQKEVLRFDVAIPDDVQQYLVDKCEEYGVDPALIVSMIFHESGYRASVVGGNAGGYSYGYMQVMPKWNKDRMDKLGVTDLLDPCQNILVGLDLIAERLAAGRGTAWALMSYNGGVSYANRMAKQGRVSKYATRIMNYAEQLERNYILVDVDKGGDV